MASKAFTLSTIFSAVDRLSGPTKTMAASMMKFQKATKTAGAVGKAMLGVGKAIVGVGAAAAGAAIAVERVLTPFATKGDEIAKSARMFGMSTDALQELRYAAGMQGVETESLNVAFKQLNNNLGQLKAGEGALYSRLSKTNPQLARQLRVAEDTDAAFMLMMEAIEAEGDAAKRAALAQAAFGKSGQELIKFAVAGKGGIAALREEAHRYGIVVSEEAANASEAYSDSLSRLKQSAAGLFNEVLGRAIVKIQPVVQAMADWVAANKELIGQKIDQVIAGVGRAFEIITAPGVLSGFATLVIGLKTFTAVAAALGATNPITLTITAIAALITLIVTNWDKITGFFDRMKSGGKMSGQTSLASQALGAGGIPTSPNTPAMESRSFSESRSILDVNFNNAPAGTSYRQSGAAPGITLNTGRLTP